MAEALFDVHIIFNSNGWTHSFTLTDISPQYKLRHTPKKNTFLPSNILKKIKLFIFFLIL